MMRELIGAFVELTVRQLLFFEDDRYGIRSPCHLFLKELMHTLVARIVHSRVVPLHQQLMTLRF